MIKVSHQTFIQQFLTKCLLSADLYAGAGGTGALRLVTDYQLCERGKRKELGNLNTENVGLVQAGELGKEAQRKGKMSKRQTMQFYIPSGQQTSDKTNCCQECGATETLILCWWSVN